MITGIEYPSLLAPILAFLAARAAARALGRRLPGGATALLVALGAAAAAFFDGLGLQKPVSAYWAAADAASLAALAAIGAELGYRSGRARPRAGRELPSWRRSIIFILPLATAAALASGFGLAGGSALAPVYRTTLLLSAALWLSVPQSGPTVAAVLASFALASSPGPASATALMAALTAAAAMALSASAARKAGGADRPASGLLLGAAPALALLLAWSLRTASLSWPAAGLCAGLAYGLWRRYVAEGGGSAPGPKAGGSAFGSPSAETGSVLAFVAGYGLSAARLGDSVAAAAIIGAATLGAAAIAALLSGTRRPYLPSEAAAFAALLVAKRAGLVSDAAIAGVTLAYLAASPLARSSSRQEASDHDVPVKALVGVSPAGTNPGTLAFAAAIGAAGEPVRAACVASVESGSGHGPAEAEQALVRCVAAGAAADVRVLPSVVVSASVPDGLARSALERRADAVVIGIKPGDSRAALNGLLLAFPGSVVAMRRAEAYAQGRRLIALAVAGTEADPGFRVALAAAARARAGGTGTMEALLIGGRAESLAEASAGLIDERSVSAVRSWRDVPAALDAKSTQSASFIVFATRPGTKDWNPGHERLPAVIESAYPNAALTLWFLPKREPRPESSAPRPGGADHDSEAPAGAGATIAEAAGPRPGRDRGWPPIVASAFESGRVLADMPEEALVDAIRRLTDAVFPADRGSAGRLAAAFSAIARKEPIELAPGILLLHARSAGLAMPTLAMGSRSSGWPLVALSEPVRITVALVSPDDSGPETHLEALTQIAGAFRSQGLAERLLAKPGTA